MTLGSYAFGILTSLLTIAVVIELLRRRKLRERHATWWLLAGTLALVVGVFPGILAWAADLLGFKVPANLTFFVSIAILFLVCLQHSAELTQLESKTRRLAELVTLQELRIGELEARLIDPPKAPRVPKRAGKAD